MECYPHVLNITVRRCCQAAFGSKGDMSNPHIQQLHYKIAWLHHEGPNVYQSMYTILGLLDKEPPLPQMWVETRWEYLHNHLQWYAQYESPCLSLAKEIIARISSSDSHLSIWKNVIKWSSSPLIQVERAFLAEFLEIFIISTLKQSQTSDKEICFTPGYLARLWPYSVRQHILQLKSYEEYPDKFFPKTLKLKFNSLKDREQSEFFSKHIQAPFLREAVLSVTEHGGSWLMFPKLFAAGADKKWNNLFWRAVLRCCNKLV